jgi:hypothetical protein
MAASNVFAEFCNQAKPIWPYGGKEATCRGWRAFCFDISAQFGARSAPSAGHAPLTNAEQAGRVKKANESSGRDNASSSAGQPDGD